MSTSLKEKASSKEVSRAESVHRALREDILNLKIKPSDRIYESSIAEKLDASRTPVREALQKLQADGLLQRQGRAYIVPDVTVTFVENLYTVREALECKAIQLCALDRTRLEVIGETIDAMEAAVRRADYRSFNVADITFHKQLAMAANNDLLDHLLETIWDRVLFVRSTAFQQIERLSESLTEHRRIVEALQKGNNALAEEEMRAHLRSVPIVLKGRL